jgi:hypothetical protein
VCWEVCVCVGGFKGVGQGGGKEGKEGVRSRGLSVASDLHRALHHSPNPARAHGRPCNEPGRRGVPTTPWNAAAAAVATQRSGLQLARASGPLDGSGDASHPPLLTHVPGLPSAPSFLSSKSGNTVTGKQEYKIPGSSEGSR